MNSSAPRSVEPRGSRITRVGGLVALLALAVPLASAAETAFETCDAANVDANVLTLCLEGLAGETEDELAQLHRQALTYFEGLDAITGNDRASRTLAQSQAAFALFRELDCHLAELDQGLGEAAVQHGLACGIDLDRARIARLTALIGDAATVMPEAGPDDTPPSSLQGTAWQVAAIDGEPTDSEIEMTLEVDDQGAFSGVGGCNRYFGTADIDAEGGITFGGIGATRMACPEPVMAEETRYFGALERVTRFALTTDGLELLGPADEVLVRLEPRAD
jgi:heat shock protein HslJ